MTTFVPPKVSTQFIFYASLVSQANTKLMQVNPTIAAGDFKVSIDGGALNNLGTLPAVTPAGSSMVKFTLATTEMAGANATVVCIDAAGAEWCDLTVNLQTVANQVDDIGSDVDAILVDTDTTIPGLIAALNNLSAPQVNAEVLDVLNVDTFAQPGQSTPAATTSIRLMLAWLYKAWRNKTTQSATEYDLFNDDAATIDQKGSFSDDGTTATRGEIATGP